MKLDAFKNIVDCYPDSVTPLNDNLEALYSYVDLSGGSAFLRRDVSKELCRKIMASFASGHQAAWRICRDLREELIQRNVIDGQLLDPYFLVLDHLQNALIGEGQIAGDIAGDWTAAIHHACDSLRIDNWSASPQRERMHTRFFEVARAAKRLKQAGVELVRDGNKIGLDRKAETKLIEYFERTIASMGGINLARHVFKQISPLYDAEQERYHLVRHHYPSGGGVPDVPFGYLLLLAAKHFAGTRPIKDSEEIWSTLCQLSRDYAAVMDVQGYSPTAWHSMDAFALLPHLQEVAVYDTMFRIPQIKGSDVTLILRGILKEYDFTQKRGGGWSLNDVLSVIDALMKFSQQKRGPVCIDLRSLAAACTPIESQSIAAVIDEVLCHPQKGANQFFSKPTDAPTQDSTEGKRVGHDFFQRPLLSADRKKFWLLDHAMCALPCVEAVLGALRKSEKGFDSRLGVPIEKFVRDQFAAHGVLTLTGKYKVDGEDGECDIIVETANVIVFIEIKKKSLSRVAQAGSHAHVLLDLAYSMLEAQVQAGWHETRLARHGFLDLEDDGVRTRLELKGRKIENVALSLMQFGSFQDRIFLKQFLEATLRANFGVNDASLQKDFDKFNALLGELRAQINELHAGAATLNQPFFHCWFLSIPQLLVMLESVTDPESFKKSLWKTRHTTTGSADFYRDYAWFLKAEREAAARESAASEG